MMPYEKRPSIIPENTLYVSDIMAMTRLSIRSKLTMRTTTWKMIPNHYFDGDIPYSP